ncbi:MAG: tRNA-dihydrouridine synthase [Candidatus Magasanikbacteria bacterium]|nr:tRNA-dihydrouridine synthase [Candidatus Magasanikbacteria bacterium]
MWINQKRPIIALAPMADMTDSPFCRVCREVSGGGFVVFREMVSAEALVRGNEKTLKMCEFDEIERPIVLQIFGGEPVVVAEAARILVGDEHPPCSPLCRGETLRPDGIDVNMGCPVPKIARKSKAGASLMKDHERAVAIVKALKNANLGVPVSVKTRLGWSKDDEILEFAPKLEQAGADTLAIHGRTKKQGYSGVANWEVIGEVKKRVSIPVIANGDIHSRDDIGRCLEITGADGVMIGRAALGNPWLLSGYTDNPDLRTSELRRVVLRHARLHLKHYGEEFGLKTFRKHLLYYFKGFAGVKELRQRLVRVEKYEELEMVLVWH